MELKEIIKHLKVIENDCKYGTSYGTKEVNCGKFYERVKGIMSISENNI